MFVIVLTSDREEKVYGFVSTECMQDKITIY